MPTTTRDPWLTGDMRHEQILSAAERDLLAALGTAQRAYLNECRRAVLHTSTTAAAREPHVSLERWPARERWAALLRQHVLPVLRRWYRKVFTHTSTAPPDLHRWEQEYLDQFTTDPWPDSLYEQAADELDDSRTAGDDTELQRDRLDLLLRMTAPVRRIRDRISQYRRDRTKVPDGVWELAQDEETHRNDARYRARHYTVGTYNRATLDAGAVRARSEGIAAFKTWYGTTDERIRPSHWAAHKQSVPMGDWFRVGGAELRYPGDPTAPIKEWANCRCTVLIVDGEESAQMNAERAQELPHRTDADGRPLVAADTTPAPSKPKKRNRPDPERDGEPTEPGRPEDTPPHDPAQPPPRPAPGGQDDQRQPAPQDPQQPPPGNQPQPDDPGVRPPDRNTPQNPPAGERQPGDPGPQEHAPGEAGPPGGTRSIAEEEAEEVQPSGDGRWRGLLAPLETRGDFRVIGTPPDGVVRVRDRMWLAYQPSSAPEHQGKVVVGRIDRAWIENGNLMGEGVLDLGDPMGQEVQRKLAEGFAGTVSVDLDDAEAEERHYDDEGFEVDEHGAPQFGAVPIVAAPPGAPARKKPRVPTEQDDPDTDEDDSGSGGDEPGQGTRPGRQPPEERRRPSDMPDDTGDGEKDQPERAPSGDDRPTELPAPGGDDGAGEGQPRKLLYVYNWRLGGATLVPDPAFHTANIQLVSPGTTPAEQQADNAQPPAEPGADPEQQSPGGADGETGEARKKKSSSKEVTVTVSSGGDGEPFVARTPSGAVTDSARDKAADTGNALPDGSFPINTVSDLRNAIQAIGRASDPGKAKAHIRKRAKALGRSDLIPESWGSGGDSNSKTASLGHRNNRTWAEQIADVARAVGDPPREWFQNPGLTQPTKVTVTPDGRIIGHVACWNTSHISYPGRNVRPPRSATGYAQFHRHPVRCAGGERVRTGVLVMDTGHADLQASESGASAHYDHTGHAVADVVAGEDQHGVWISGALHPNVTPLQIQTLDRYSLSGDWRNGELVAALVVNVPGFPIPDLPDAVAASGARVDTPRLRVRTGPDGATVALVASGIVAPPPAAAGPPGRADTDVERRAWADLRARRRVERIDRRVHSMARRVHRPTVTAAARRVFTFSRATADLPPELRMAEAHLAAFGASNGAGHGYNADEMDELDDQDHRLITRITNTNWSLDGDDDEPGKGETAAAFATNWVDKQGGLPSYIKRIARHLKGSMGKSRAIATAVNVVKKMCRGGGDKLNWPGAQSDVNKGSVGEACAAVAQWNKMKAAEAAD